MSTVQEQILDEFCQRLRKSEGFTNLMVDQLRALLGGDKKPKANDLVKVLSEATEPPIGKAP